MCSSTTDSVLKCKHIRDRNDKTNYDDDTAATVVVLSAPTMWNLDNMGLSDIAIGKLDAYSRRRQFEYHLEFAWKYVFTRRCFQAAALLSTLL